jgi:signal transduction histidine kinase
MDSQALYAAYLGQLNGDQMVRSARTGTLVVIGLNTSFIALDYWTHADRFGALLGLRLAWDLVMLGIYWALARFDPMKTARIGLVITGVGMLAVIGVAGGLSGDYWPGIMILFLGVPVLLPLSPSQSGSIVGVLTCGFAALPVVTGEAPSLRGYLVPVFFAAGAALECVASSALLERLRLAEFLQRREIEKAHDELAQLDRAKARFTANVHHELRTPLTLMLAPLEGMLSGDFGAMTDTLSHYLRTMHVNGLRLLKLINNLLDLAKIESRQLEVRRRSCQVGRLVQDVATGARPMAEQKGIELVTVGLNAAPTVYADLDAIEKVVVNLVGNALKFTDEGGRIELRGEAWDPDAAGGVASPAAAIESGLHLVVSDSGIGLEPEELARVFDRFAQVDTSATRRHEGTGIGLSLAKELMEAHEGRIWAESAGLGQGTQMHVVLPVGEPDSEAEEEVVQDASGHGVALSRSMGAVQAELNLEAGNGGDGRLVEMERSVARWEGRQVPAGGPGASLEMSQAAADAPEVLIVEDNSDMRELLAFVVGQEFRLRTARNGREGLEAVRTRAPDLVLTDVMMPEMSGTELCRAIKQDPELVGLPVVLVTSKAEREMKIEGLEGGADDYVTKPFHPRELLARVRALLRVRQLQTDLEDRNWALERMNEELERALSELKEAEVQVLQSERLAAVGELAAGVAHEVNNPVNFALNALRTLGSNVEALAEASRAVGELDARDPAKLAGQLRELEDVQARTEPAERAAELLELVSIVTEGLERTSRLVGDLRDFAGSGGGEHAHVAVNLRRGLDSTLQLLARHMHEAGVTVERALGDQPLLVSGDPAALNQVFLNLLKNSAEALDGQTGGRIWIEAGTDDGWVSLTIRDNGPGVPAEAQTRLFEPFFSTKAAGRGAGLGLSICRRIVAEHGGTIVASNLPGEGAAFTIRLPAEGTEPDDAT